MRSLQQSIARRYAQALFEATRDAGQSLDAASRDLAEVTAFLDHVELRRVLEHPGVPFEKKKKVLAAVWSGAPLVMRLVDLLLERRRLSLLPAIERSFIARWNEHRRVEPAEVVCGHPLDAGQERALRAALERASGKEVEMNVRVDPRILGGVLVRMGGRVLDGTVQSRLSSLREHLVKGRLGA
ncbi:MAG: ATP synthase F1 subunit delta [Vicinamibacteria bacterium]|nr:ATP synthase F1 subunit delta [Vicinamibacteria bacterium]